MNNSVFKTVPMCSLVMKLNAVLNKGWYFCKPFILEESW